MHPCFIKAAEQPEVVDDVIHYWFPWSMAYKTFSNVFYILFPDSKVHNGNIKSWLRTFEEFEYTNASTNYFKVNFSRLSILLGLLLIFHFAANGLYRKASS